MLHLGGTGNRFKMYHLKPGMFQVSEVVLAVIKLLSGLYCPFLIFKINFFELYKSFGMFFKYWTVD
jgi:hypothetical protein